MLLFFLQYSISLFGVTLFFFFLKKVRKELIFVEKILISYERGMHEGKIPFYKKKYINL